MHIGIDPGLSGVVAVLAADGALLAVHDTPTLTLRVARGTRHDCDVPGMVALVAPYTGVGPHVIIEASQAMPGQGVRSMFSTGYGYGLLLTAASRLIESPTAGLTMALRKAKRLMLKAPTLSVQVSPVVARV